MTTLIQNAKRFGIRDVMKEAWRIYESQDKSINIYQKIGALKLIKECHESVFHLLDEGPSIMYLKQLQERLVLVVTMMKMMIVMDYTSTTMIIILT
jgi:hypothetical protein